jgi:hypothetical protein
MTDDDAERAIRPLALGRSNRLFASSDNDAPPAATIYTITQTATLDGLGPEACLADILLPASPIIPSTEATSCCHGGGAQRARHSRRPKRPRESLDACHLACSTVRWRARPSEPGLSRCWHPSWSPATSSSL